MVRLRLFDKISLGLDMVPPFFKLNMSSKLLFTYLRISPAADNDRYQKDKR